MNKKLLYAVGGLGTAAAGAGIVAGVTVPLALKAKHGAEKALNGLTKFVGSGYDSRETWKNNNKKLNLVALGDSETAGYNALTTKTAKAFDLDGDNQPDRLLNGDAATTTERDYLSYADFLANDLNKAHKLKSYYNYAISGGRVHDQWQRVVENQLELERVKQADLITMTIGANDLLAYANLLKIPFTLSLEGIMQLVSGDSSSVNDRMRRLLFGDLNTEADKGTERENRSDELIKESIHLLNEMVQGRTNFSNLIGMKKQFVEKAFDAIKRNIIIMLRDIHNIAPQAHVLLLGYAFPFAQWTDKVINDPRKDLGGMSIKGMFNKLLDTIKAASTYAVQGQNHFGEFLAVDSMKIYKSSDSTRDGDNKTFKDYIKYDDIDTVKGGRNESFWIQNAMPNAGDIHPSTFGHELIGNSLFSHYSRLLGIQDPVSLYTMSTNFVDDGITDFKNFERIDENPANKHMLADTLSAWIKRNGTEDDKDRATLASEALRLILPDLDHINSFRPLVDLLQDDSVRAVFKDIFSAIKLDNITNIGNIINSLKARLNDSKNQSTLDFINQKLTALFTSSEHPDLITYAKGINGIINIFRTSKSSEYAQNVADVNEFAILLHDRFKNSDSTMLPMVANFLFWLTSEREATHGIFAYTNERQHNAATFVKTKLQTNQQALFDALDHLGNVFKAKTAMGEIVISNIMRALTVKEISHRKQHEVASIRAFETAFNDLMDGMTPAKVQKLNDVSIEFNKVNNFKTMMDMSTDAKATAEMKIWKDLLVLQGDLANDSGLNRDLAKTHKTLDQMMADETALFKARFNKFNAMITGPSAPALTEQGRIAIMNYLLSDGYKGTFSDLFMMALMPIMNVFTQEPPQWTMTV